MRSLYQTKSRPHFKYGLSLLVCLFGLVSLSACQKSANNHLFNGDDQSNNLADVFAAATAEGDLGFTRNLGGEASANNAANGADQGQSLFHVALPTGLAEDGSTYFPIDTANFVLLTNEIYTNYSDYLTKTLVYEGFLVARQASKTGEWHYFVIRKGPGCCAYDNMPGFEIKLPEGFTVALPDDLKAAASQAIFTDTQLPNEQKQQNTPITISWHEWVRVTGKLTTYSEGKQEYLRLNCSQIEKGLPLEAINVHH